MGKGFSDFVNDFEEKLLAEGETLEDYEYYDIAYGDTDSGEEETEDVVSEEEDLNSFKIDDDKIKRKLCYELSNFGLNDSTIRKIVENVFSEGDVPVFEEENITRRTKTKPKGEFKRKSEAIRSKIEEKEEMTTMGHASTILEGMDDMTSPGAPVDHGPLKMDEYGRPDVSNFDMNDTAEHASALL